MQDRNMKGGAVRTRYDAICTTRNLISGMYEMRYRVQVVVQTLIRVRNINTNADWVSYLGQGVFYTNFSVAAPGFITLLQLSACLS